MPVHAMVEILKDTTKRLNDLYAEAMTLQGVDGAQCRQKLIQRAKLVLGLRGHMDAHLDDWGLYEPTMIYVLLSLDSLEREAQVALETQFPLLGLLIDAKNGLESLLDYLEERIAAGED